MSTINFQLFKNITCACTVSTALALTACGGSNGGNGGNGAGNNTPPQQNNGSTLDDPLDLLGDSVIAICNQTASALPTEAAVLTGGLCTTAGDLLGGLLDALDGLTGLNDLHLLEDLLRGDLATALSSLQGALDLQTLFNGGSLPPALAPLQDALTPLTDLLSGGNADPSALLAALGDLQDALGGLSTALSGGSGLDIVPLDLGELAAIDGVSSALSTALEGVIDALNGLANGADPSSILAGLGAATGGVSNSLDSLLNIDGLVPGGGNGAATDLIANLQDAVAQLPVSLPLDLSGDGLALDNAGDLVGQIGDALAGGLPADLSGLTTGLTNALADLVGTLGDTLSLAQAGGNTEPAMLADTLTGSLGDFANSLAAQLDTLTSENGGNLPDIGGLTELSSALANLQALLGNPATSAEQLDLGVAALNTALGSVNLSTLGDQAADLTSLLSLVADTLTGVTDTITGLLDGLTANSALGNLVDGVTDLIEGLGGLDAADDAGLGDAVTNVLGGLLGTLGGNA